MWYDYIIIISGHKQEGRIGMFYPYTDFNDDNGGVPQHPLDGPFPTD